MSDTAPATTPKAQSPFIPGTQLQYAWDSTSLSAFDTCPRYYAMKHIDGWTPRTGTTPVALTFGILFHKGIENWHKLRAGGMPVVEAADKIVSDIMDAPEFSALPTGDEDVFQMTEAEAEAQGLTSYLKIAKFRTKYHLARALVWYMEEYADDSVETYIKADGEAAVELSFRIPMDHIEIAPGQPMILSGHLDRVGVMAGSYYASDLKTTSSLSRSWFAGYDTDLQMTNYTLAGKMILDKPVLGCLIDGIGLQQGAVQFKRAVTLRSDGALNAHLRWLAWKMEELKRVVDTFAGTPTWEWPARPSACKMCDLKDVCRKPPEFRGSYLKTNYVQRPPWNPLEVR